MKGHRSRVNLVMCEAKQVYFNPYVYAKATINPKKVEKINVIFSHVTGVFHWNIFATVFLCFIAGECHGSVNIDKHVLET